MTTKHEDKDEDVKDAPKRDRDVEAGAVDADAPGVEAQLATGVAPAWATDPTTNKNAAQKFV